MTKNRSLKRSLLASVLSLILCFSMLVGSTFAWFTDSVSSDTNKIYAGNLDIELEYKKVVDGVATDWAPVVGKSDVFDPNALWEPGRIEVVYLKVSNLGSLALKYALSVNVANETVGLNGAGEAVRLSDHLVFTVVEMNDDLTVYTEAEARALAEAGSKGMETYAGSTKALDAKDGANDEDYVALIVYMPKSVGNEANYRGTAVPTIALGINLVATQYTSESDSYDNTYDADAEFPVVDSGALDPGATEPLVLKVGNITTHIPANAPAGFYELSVSDISTQTGVNGSKTTTANATLLKDGEAVAPGSAVFTVETDIGVMADIESLSYNGVTLNNYRYNALDGIVSLDTNSVGALEVTYSYFGTQVVIEGGEIQSGIFTKNPATVDSSLENANNDAANTRVVVEYDKNALSSQTAMLRLSSTRAVADKVYYVSEKASTVVVGRNDVDYGLEEGNYKFENGDVPVTLVDNNNLYTITKAPNKTIYILPGTYIEGTTITVSSSMDIIGLGKAEDIKIIKAENASKSNKHLFNCSNNDASSDYIQVTIKNMYLDARNYTTNGDDTAAVQSIRKSKVKCYDLIVEKGEMKNWDCAAFYVNAGNKLNDSTYCNAYMYVENCTVINKTRTPICTSFKSGTKVDYYFFYNGLTTIDANGAEQNYTTNNLTVKNQTMAWDDWDWKN